MVAMRQTVRVSQPRELQCPETRPGGALGIRNNHASIPITMMIISDGITPKVNVVLPGEGEERRSVTCQSAD